MGIPATATAAGDTPVDDNGNGLRPATLSSYRHDVDPKDVVHAHPDSSTTNDEYAGCPPGERAQQLSHDNPHERYPTCNVTPWHTASTRVSNAQSDAIADA